jgi:uncharacterized protein
MIYLDTSVIVAALSHETSTLRVQNWLAEQVAGELNISGWVITEVSSALAIKVRVGVLTINQRAEIMRVWHQMQVENFHVVKVSQSHFDMAARFIDQVELSLRAGDALHLAIASTSGYHLATLDKVMAAAGPKLGIPVIAP